MVTMFRAELIEQELVRSVQKGMEKHGAMVYVNGTGRNAFQDMMKFYIHALATNIVVPTVSAYVKVTLWMDTKTAATIVMKKLNVPWPNIPAHI